MAAGRGIEHAPERPPVDRRTLRSELLVVLGVAFLAAMAGAFLRLARLIADDQLRSSLVLMPYGDTFSAWAFAAYMLQWLTQLAPVGLIAHLLARADAGLRTIGFDLTQRARDMARGVLTAIPFVALSVGFAWALDRYELPFVHIRLVDPESHLSVMIPMLFASAGTAILEETIVNGYTLTRLEQLGWSARRALVASALIRASYHLYQGLGGFLYAGIAGIAFGRLYQRWRRIMPLVVAHFVIDAALGAMDLSLGGRYPWL